MNASNGQPGHNLIGETGDRGANVSDQTAVSDVQRVQTLTMAAAIIFACRGKESLDEALKAANEIFQRVLIAVK